jgi:hypothetical protein
MYNFIFLAKCQNFRVLNEIGALAQLVEHRTFNPLVERSNRSRPTILLVI